MYKHQLSGHIFRRVQLPQEAFVDICFYMNILYLLFFNVELPVNFGKLIPEHLYVATYEQWWLLVDYSHNPKISSIKSLTLMKNAYTISLLTYLFYNDGADTFLRSKNCDTYNQ